MIVRPAGSVLHLITQPDHAALSGALMRRWRPLQDHPARESILLAIAEHDNGWREPDASPAIDPSTRRVADFVNAPAAVRQEVWPRGVARLAHDPWAAALVAQHAVAVYARYRADRGWDTFFAGMEALRDTHARAAGRDVETLPRDYDFVRLGDLISLTFCTGWTDPQDYAGYRVHPVGNRVVVSPHLFDAPDIPFAIGARVLPDRPFDSDDDLRRAFRAAPIVTLQGAVVSGAS